MAPALLDVDPDVYVSVGRAFLDVNDAVCDVVAAAANTANTAPGMAGVDSTGAAWAADYDAAADALLRAGSTVVDALGVVGDRLTVSGANHDDAEAASVAGPHGTAGPPSYPGSPGTSRAVGVVVSKPPSADGTPTDPPPGWWLIAHLIAWTWPAGHPDQLIAVGTGWLTASLKLSDEADRLSGPIADLSGQTSPDVPYAVSMSTGLQTALRTLADEYAVVARVCTGYASSLEKMHQDVVVELVDLVASEAIVEIVGALASGPTGGAAQVPTQAVAGARVSAAAVRVGGILARLAEDVATHRNLVVGIAERVVSVLTSLETVTAQRELLQAVTALVDAGIPPVDLQANEDGNPSAHVIEKHVAKSDSYLIGRNIRVASTFTSMAAATTAISSLIAASKSQVTAWLAGNTSELRLYGVLPSGMGRSYLRDSGKFVESTKFRVTLRRNTYGYFVFTAFPEP